MTGNPIRPNPNDVTDIAWAASVASHVVRTYTSTALRDTDNPTPHTGQMVTITTGGGGIIVQTWDGTQWKTHPGNTAARYHAFTAGQAWDNGWYSQVGQVATLPIRKRGPNGVTRLLVGAWLNGLYATAVNAGLGVAVGNDVGGPSGDAATAQLVEVGVGQLQTAPGVSVGGWNIMDRNHGDWNLSVFWRPSGSGARLNSGLSSASLVVIEIGA